MKDKEYIMFRIKRTTAEKLKQLGHKGETYDTIINKLIDKTKGD